MGLDLLLDWWRSRGAAGRVKTQYDLAVLRYQQHQLAQAEQAAAKAFSALQKLGRPSTLTIPLVVLIAQIHKDAGKDMSAVPVFGVAVQLLKKVYGEKSIKVGVALHELGVSLSRVGLPERAIGVLEECIPILEQHFGKDHADVAAALSNLGIAQSQGEHYADAERTQRRVIAMR